MNLGGQYDGRLYVYDPNFNAADPLEVFWPVNLEVWIVLSGSSLELAFITEPCVDVLRMFRDGSSHTQSIMAWQFDNCLSLGHLRRL